MVMSVIGVFQTWVKRHSFTRKTQFPLELIMKHHCNGTGHLVGTVNRLVPEYFHVYRFQTNDEKWCTHPANLHQKKKMLPTHRKVKHRDGHISPWCVCRMGTFSAYPCAYLNASITPASIIMSGSAFQTPPELCPTRLKAIASRRGLLSWGGGEERKKEVLTVYSVFVSNNSRYI